MLFSPDASKQAQEIVFSSKKNYFSQSDLYFNNMPLKIKTGQYSKRSRTVFRCWAYIFRTYKWKNKKAVKVMSVFLLSFSLLTI